MGLNEEDRKLISQHHIGKAILKLAPGLRKPLSAIVSDTNVQNIIVGGIAHTGLGLVARGLLSNTLLKKPGKQ